MTTTIANDAETAYQQALALHQQGRLEEAQAGYRRVLELQPEDAAALNLLGIIALQTNDPRGAVDLIARALLIDPDDAAAHINCGSAHSQLEQYEAAVACFERAIALDTASNASAYYNRGTALQRLKRNEFAIASYDQAIALGSDQDAEAYYGRGMALQDLGRYAAAVASFDRAIDLDSVHRAEACCSRGNALQALERYDAAAESYAQALTVKPDYAQALRNRGIALAKLKRYEPALESLAQAALLEPADPMTHKGRGNVLCALRRHREAVASFNHAIALDPDDAEAYNNLGVAQAALSEFSAALDSYYCALIRKPDYAEAYNNRGLVLATLERFDAALMNYDKAVSIDGGYAGAHYNRGNLLTELQRPIEALVSYDHAAAIDPGHPFLAGQRLSARMKICDWEGIDDEVALVSGQISRNEAVCQPMTLLGLSGSAALQQKAAQIWVREKCPADSELGPLGRSSRHEKIRVGYFSADFCEHPVSLLTAQLFEIHDRSRFEITAFAFGPEAEDPMRERLKRAFDRFIDVRRESDREVASLARTLELDIAIDLGGFTAHCRPGIFALRAAPLQISYVGYAGTLGAEYMDYLLADLVIIPPAQRSHYSEKILYLPSYQVNDSTRRVVDPCFSRVDIGLPRDGFVYCCFNAPYKITPGTFAGWMRILTRVPGSALFLYADSAVAIENLRRQASRHGVEPRRLVFGDAVPIPFKARYHAADLFLDTLPYNAGTIASEALWAGLPVLTCAGEAFASRMAASLLTAIGIPELVAATQERYEDLAVELGTDPGRIAGIKEQLAKNRLATPLFDCRRFARHLEAGYATIYERHLAGLPPEDVRVDHPTAAASSGEAV